MLDVTYFSARPLRFALCLSALLCVARLCAQTSDTETGQPATRGSIASAADEWPSVVIGFIGQSRYQPQAVAALAGAIDAARELGPTHRMHVSVAHRSPQMETAQAQNEALRQLFLDGTSGVLINPADPSGSEALLALLNRQRVPVVTFGTTARIQGISAAVVDDEEAIGDALAAEVFTLLDARVGRRGGGIAVLTASTEPYASRARAVGRQLDRSAQYANYGIFNCAADMNSALQTLHGTTAAERDERLNAWISVGGWPLLGHNVQLPRSAALAGIVVADGLPQMLPYLERGQVRSLVSPDYYRLGYEAMRLVLLEQKARLKTDDVSSEGVAEVSMGAPSTGKPVRIQVPPRVIRRENLDEYKEQWGRWLGQSM